MLKRLIQKFTDIKFDSLIEGMYAHDYTNEKIREKIADDYNKRYKKPPNPLTHPELYDPLNPPAGYVYDPYYECWVEMVEL